MHAKLGLNIAQLLACSHMATLVGNKPVHAACGMTVAERLLQGKSTSVWIAVWYSSRRWLSANVHTHCSAVYCIHKAVKALALQPSHADHVGARHESGVRYMQVYMDSINDLLWEEQGSGGARPKLEVRMGAFGSHLPGLVEKQV